MKTSSFLSLLILISHLACTQAIHKVTYTKLKEFEGFYEYINNTTLNLALSPVDTDCVVCDH